MYSKQFLFKQIQRRNYQQHGVIGVSSYGHCTARKGAVMKTRGPSWSSIINTAVMHTLHGCEHFAQHHIPMHVKKLQFSVCTTPGTYYNRQCILYVSHLFRLVCFEG